ncbi:MULTISPECIES: fluoride efflux transporter CrcB [unclassified Thalassospira]|jgi:CrcB protein|uniref:fluoride efflux transporter CrcB n=1 Tax=unclassified Thalassospira TaxID=2648997 RepID=UPI000A1FDB95|nr:fluoride efflux transporter CrcB [Thalassospira sp. MCCC 1A01428]OSQ41103.1 protein CrcB [Thalassospira sp. MCCC 1A01428]
MQFSPIIFACVALGGALGAMSRYVVSGWFNAALGHGFPWGTFAVNIIGSFIMGLVIELGALKFSIGPEIRAVVITGFLGAFTTFSTFSLDVATLYERGSFALAALYVTVSVFVGISALFGAMALVRGAVQ